jgi:hypothetical protein
MPQTVQVRCGHGIWECIGRKGSVVLWGFEQNQTFTGDVRVCTVKLGINTFATYHIVQYL